MDLRSGRFWIGVLVLALAIGGGIFLLTSREAAEAKKAVDNAADAATGNQAVRVGNEIKSDLRNILDRRAR